MRSSRRSQKLEDSSSRTLISKTFPLEVSHVDSVILGHHPNLESVSYNQSDTPDDISSPPNTEDDGTDSNDGLLGSGGSNHYTGSPNSTPPPPPTFEEIDNWNHHIDMKALGRVSKGLPMRCSPMRSHPGI
jgi:hypothetical protein